MENKMKWNQHKQCRFQKRHMRLGFIHRFYEGEIVAVVRCLFTFSPPHSHPKVTRRRQVRPPDARRRRGGICPLRSSSWCCGRYRPEWQNSLHIPHFLSGEPLSVGGGGYITVLPPFEPGPLRRLRRRPLEGRVVGGGPSSSFFLPNFLTQHPLNSDPWSRCRAAFTGQEYPECELHGGSDLCLKRADSCRKWRIVPGRSSAALVAALLTPGWWVRQEGAKWNSATPGMPIPSCRTQCKHLLLRNPRQKLIHPNVILDRVVQLQPREMWSFVLHLVRFESAGSYCWLWVTDSFSWLRICRFIFSHYTFPGSNPPVF